MEVKNKKVYLCTHFRTASGSQRKAHNEFFENITYQQVVQEKGRDNTRSGQKGIKSLNTVNCKLIKKEGILSKRNLKQTNYTTKSLILAQDER